MTEEGEKKSYSPWGLEFVSADESIEDLNYLNLKDGGSDYHFIDFR